MSGGAAAANTGRTDDEATIDIAAPATTVWALLSDVTNMPRWSPETYRAQWVDGATRPAVGARFRGWNRAGWVRWSTTCEVEVCEPGREFTFSTRFGPHRGTRWSYRLAENEHGGTTVLETRQTLYKPRYARIAYATVLRGHEGSFAAGMVKTLQRLRDGAQAVA